MSGPWYPKKRQIEYFSLPPYAGVDDALKGASPGLSGGVHYFSRVVLGCQYAEESNAWIKEPILGYIGGVTALRLVLNAGLGNVPKGVCLALVEACIC